MTKPHFHIKFVDWDSVNNNPDEIQKLLDNFTKKGKDKPAASEWR